MQRKCGDTCGDTTPASRVSHQMMLPARPSNDGLEAATQPPKQAALTPQQAKHLLLLLGNRIDFVSERLDRSARLLLLAAYEVGAREFTFRHGGRPLQSHAHSSLFAANNSTAAPVLLLYRRPSIHRDLLCRKAPSRTVCRAS